MPKFSELPDPNDWFVVGAFVVCWGIVLVAYALRRKKG